MIRTRKAGGYRLRQSVRKRAGLSRETFDEFLASLELLEGCEEDAVKEIASEQQAANSLD
jgi:hypothetical protein